MPRGAARSRLGCPARGARAPTRRSRLRIHPLRGREVPQTGGRRGAGAQTTGTITAGAATITVGA
eukprot:3964786-Pyramimonas_sp.AAC.1